jgi:pimeloyl-ACP methyl ester carboxylesterase
VQAAIAGLREWGSPDFSDQVRWAHDACLAYDRCFDPAGTTRQFMAVRASGDRAQGLRNLRVPTLVIHGDRDTLISADGGRRTAELIPGARFELIEGMGHDYPPQLWSRWVDLIGAHALG